MPRPVGGAFLALALLLSGGCPSCPTSGSPAAPPSSRTARTASGVKVPLPEGWNVGASDEGVLTLGPKGRAVLRIDLRPASAGQLPTVAALRDGFKGQLAGVRLHEVEEESKENLSLVVLELSTGSDAGASSMALLGAKRVGADLYLCSTVPGSTSDEVKLAAQACRDIHLPQEP